MLGVQARLSNFRHRPIGIGVQGLADAFILMRYPFESEEAQLLNKKIFETIYYAALEASCELAEQLGPYETYPGSPVSKGVNQTDSMTDINNRYQFMSIWSKKVKNRMKG